MLAVGKQESRAWVLYQSKQCWTELLTQQSCPDSIKHVSYLWPDICRMLNEAFAELRCEIGSARWYTAGFCETRRNWNMQKSQAAHAGTARIFKHPRCIISDFQCWQKQRRNIPSLPANPQNVLALMLVVWVCINNWEVGTFLKILTIIPLAHTSPINVKNGTLKCESWMYPWPAQMLSNIVLI